MADARLPEPNRTRRRVILAIVLIPFALMGACVYSVLRSYAWSQEIAAEIEVDGARYSGSSIARVVWGKRFVVDLAGGFIGFRLQSRVDAEAAVIDVPGRKPVFVLLQHGDDPGGGQPLHVLENNRPYLGADLAARTLLPRLGLYKTRTQTEEAAEIAARKGETRPIPESYRPLLAVFDNLSDPGTLRVVTNDSELSAALGARAHIKSITLTIANKNPTQGRLRGYLPWLPERTIEADGADNTSVAAVTAAFSKAQDAVARQIVPRHFLIRVCFGSALPCPEK